MPRKLIERTCPLCKEVKMMRPDVKTCGCAGSGVNFTAKLNLPGGPPVERVTDHTSKAGQTRTINVDATRICNEDQLIEALQIDLNKWFIDDFTVRKWEMGYVASKDKTDFAGGPSGVKGTSTTTFTPGHHQLFAVSAKLKRVVTEKDNDGFVKDNVRLMKENKRLQIQNSAEKRYRNQLVETTAGIDEAIKQIRDIVGELGQVKMNPTVVKQMQPAYQLAIKDTHTEDAVFMLSDTHFGDVIRPGDTSGFPEFDLPISGNRIGYVIRKVKSILTMHRAMYPLKKLIVWVGGDMGNGDLHDAPVSNALFIGPQVDFTFKMLKFALEDLLQLTVPDPITGVRVVEEVVLMFTCGNHMRESTSKYMPMKYQAQRTFDWLIYQMLIEWFKDTPRVTVEQAMSPYIFRDIRGHRYGFAHGMQVGYRNSPDTQAKTMDAFLKTVRSLFDSPEFRRKNGLEGSTFSRFCIGDIHVPVTFPRLKSNGSLNGQNELGVNWGLEPIPAGQQLFGVTEKHLESWAYFVECSHIQKDADSWNDYGHYAAEYERKFGRT
jgi:hypothetical protein